MTDLGWPLELLEGVRKGPKGEGTNTFPYHIQNQGADFNQTCNGFSLLCRDLKFSIRAIGPQGVPGGGPPKEIRGKL